MICNMSRRPTNLNDNPLKLSCDLILQDNMKIDLATSYLDNYFNYKKLNCVNHLYDTKIKKLDKFCVNVFFLPWYHKEPVTTFTDDAFVSKMSEEKIKQLALKLRDLLASMKEHDYDPKKFKDRKLGHVTGYFLKHGSPEDKLRFYVVSGNHRVAAYKSLFPERNSIPIIFEDFRFMKPRDRQNCGFLALEEYPNIFSSSNIENWPSVRSGFLSKDEALSILFKYIYI